VRFTVSIGLSTLKNGEDGLEAVMNRADAALLAAKQSGKNRIVVG
jgi:PleD family two-component response regulator